MFPRAGSQSGFKEPFFSGYYSSLLAPQKKHLKKVAHILLPPQIPKQQIKKRHNITQKQTTATSRNIKFPAPRRRPCGSLRHKVHADNAGRAAKSASSRAFGARGGMTLPLELLEPGLLTNGGMKGGPRGNEGGTTGGTKKGPRGGTKRATKLLRWLLGQIDGFFSGLCSDPPRKA